jgi:hypothetical protein
VDKNDPNLLEELHSTLKGASVEGNLENGDEQQETINAVPGWDALHHSLCEIQSNLYNPYAAEIAGNKYEEMVDAFEQLNNILERSTMSATKADK